MYKKLKNIAEELHELAEKLEHNHETCCETADHNQECETVTHDKCEKHHDEAETCTHTTTQSNFSPKGPNLQMPFKMPGLGNMFGGLFGGNMFGGLPNLNSLPKNLTELQQNPQLMQMLQNLPNNPQMLNAVSQMGGVDKEQILDAIANLNGDTAPIAQPTVSTPTPPGGAPFWQPESLSLKRGAAKGDPLERLLNRWHWRY